MLLCTWTSPALVTDYLREDLHKHDQIWQRLLRLKTHFLHHSCVVPILVMRQLAYHLKHWQGQILK